MSHSVLLPAAWRRLLPTWRTSNNYVVSCSNWGVFFGLVGACGQQQGLLGGKSVRWVSGSETKIFLWTAVFLLFYSFIILLFFKSHIHIHILLHSLSYSTKPNQHQNHISGNVEIVSDWIWITLPKNTQTWLLFFNSQFFFCDTAAKC